jgi:acyl-CoA dehydrogenase
MSVGDLLISTAERIFAETCTYDAVERAEHDGWAPAAWDALAQAGLPLVSVPEEAGGVGGTVADALAVLRIAGRHAAPVPMAETGMLAGWLLASAALRVTDGPATVVPGTPADTVALVGATLTGVAYEVPWARRARSLVVLVEDGDACRVALVDPGAARVEPAVNLAGEPRDCVHFDATPIVHLASTPIDRSQLELRGALTRVVLMAGALERVRDLTVAYTNDRHQFGRPVARFQLVQEHLVHLAQDAALLGMAADAAVRATVKGDGAFEVSAAKALAGAAATSGTRAAHQAHGAMGMTREYPLHHVTRRLWSWRREYGQAHRWELEVGRHAVSAGADDLYPLVTG